MESRECAKWWQDSFRDAWVWVKMIANFQNAFATALEPKHLISLNYFTEVKKGQRGDNYGASPKQAF